MKVLDLPDEQDNPIRQILLKQDDNTLEELAKKSKQEIQTFLLQAKESSTMSVKRIRRLPELKFLPHSPKRK